MSKINLRNFQLSALVATSKFTKFSKEFQFFLDARDAFELYKTGKRTFSTVELMNPLEELKEKRDKKVKQAMNALFRLNAAYKLETGANIVDYIENINESIEVLEEIEAYIYQLENEYAEKRRAQN